MGDTTGGVNGGPGDDSFKDREEFFRSAMPIDVADWLGQKGAAEVSRILGELILPRRALVFESLPLAVQVALAGQMVPQDLAALVTLMDADDRADLFKQLSPDKQQGLALHLGVEERDDIRRLSSYPEDSAGAMMTTDYALLDAGMTTLDAIAALRSAAPSKETIYRSYVVDDRNHLVGSVRLHELILADPGTAISEIMDPAPVSVAVNEDREVVALMIARYDVLALPVVDGEGNLVGIVTHDDAADVMQAETTEDFQKIATVLPFTQSLREAGIGILYSRRIVWLALLVFGNLFSGAGIAYFESTILAHVSLVFFLPLLIDSSGNAGSQSATLIVRALATGDVKMKDWAQLMLRELGVAAALGATMALVVLPLGIVRGGVEIAIVIGLTMLTVVFIGSLVGLSLPFLLSRLRLDPATASGPLVTTISDAVGVLVYFSIATAVLTH